MRQPVTPEAVLRYTPAITEKKRGSRFAMFESLRTNAASKMSLLTAISALAVPTFDKVQAQEAGSGDVPPAASQANTQFSVDLSQSVVTLRSGAIGQNASSTDGQQVRLITYNTNLGIPPGTFTEIECDEPSIVVGIRMVLAGYTKINGSLDVNRPPFDKAVQFAFAPSAEAAADNLNDPSFPRVRFEGGVPEVRQWGVTTVIPGRPGATFLASFSLQDLETLNSSTNIVVLPAGKSVILPRIENSPTGEGGGAAVVVHTTGEVGQDYNANDGHPIVLPQDLAIEVDVVRVRSLASALRIEPPGRLAGGELQPQSVTPPASVRVSWESAADVFELQRCTTLDGSWEKVESVQRNGTTYSAECASVEGSGFFRLMVRSGAPQNGQ